MDFTALHRLLGRQPGPLTDDMLNEAVAQGVTETDDLDWKSELPPPKGITQTDYPKDIAAMANSGGGVIVYGIDEEQKAATSRLDVGEIEESYERMLRSAAVTAISPPVFGLGVYTLGNEGERSLAIVIPASIDGPHLIYRGEYFGAPIRNDADTVWMKERQVEAMYRARFDERRNATEALTRLFDEAAGGRDTKVRAWLIGVARPRIPSLRTARMTRNEARTIFERSGTQALVYAGRDGIHPGIHPLETVDRSNPRPGLRRWVAPNTAVSDNTRWREAWASGHDDGSVTISTAIGGRRSRDGYLPGHRIESSSIECCVADLMGLIRVMSEHAGTTEYEVCVGIEWMGEEPLVIQTVDGSGYSYDDGSVPLARYTPVITTVVADADNDIFYGQVHDLAADCVNQGGVENLQMIERTRQ